MPPTRRSTMNHPPGEMLLMSLSSSANSISPLALIFSVVPSWLCVTFHDWDLSPDDQ